MAEINYRRGNYDAVRTQMSNLIRQTEPTAEMLLEKHLKKRIAYSSVSQVSYIVLGLMLLTPDGVTGGLLQLVAHAFAKSCLFLSVDRDLRPGDLGIDEGRQVDRHDHVGGRDRGARPHRCFRRHVAHRAGGRRGAGHSDHHGRARPGHLVLRDHPQPLPSPVNP